MNTVSGDNCSLVWTRSGRVSSDPLSRAGNGQADLMVHGFHTLTAAHHSGPILQSFTRSAKSQAGPGIDRERVMEREREREEEER